MLSEMKQLVREKNICVLATIADGKPYCSLMAYAANPEGAKIYMATHRTGMMAPASAPTLPDTRHGDRAPSVPRLRPRRPRRGAIAPAMDRRRLRAIPSRG
jgi:hypothetical protein